MQASALEVFGVLAHARLESACGEDLHLVAVAHAEDLCKEGAGPTLQALVPRGHRRHGEVAAPQDAGKVALPLRVPDLTPVWLRPRWQRCAGFVWPNSVRAEGERAPAVQSRGERGNTGRWPIQAAR